jgi:hypothetical protein
MRRSLPGILATIPLLWACGAGDSPAFGGLDLPAPPDAPAPADAPGDAGTDPGGRDVPVDPGAPDPGQPDVPGGDLPPDAAPDGGGIDVVDIDLPYPLCQPCRVDLDCKGASGNPVCIPDGNDGSWCGLECAQDAQCPDGFDCRTVRPEVRQCVPRDGGTCPCLQRYVDAGFLTTCWRENEHGRCEQDRRCDQPCTVATPAAEACNGLDDDCDGAIDDGLGSTTCGEGECRVTTANCIDGVPTACVPRDPVAEVCDNRDNDCNGAIDDEIPDLVCGLGICRNTVTACIDGRPQSCNPRPAGIETCNGLDDDCNGLDDDGLGTTTCGLGACATTVENCVAGQPQACEPGAPTDEICNGVDDDCNGPVDDGLGSTTCGKGACQVTVDNCVDGLPQACVPKDAGIETCNGVDDDCDGAIDNGFPVGQACDGPDSDQCRNGKFTCKADGTGVECAAETVVDIAEKCNGVDDDCDGQRDETGCPCPVATYGGHLYLFCTATANWEDARDRCRAVSYDLAAIADAAENKWVFDTAGKLSSDPWWIGLNDRNREGTWVWSNGEPVVYAPWQSGQPNNYFNQDCVDIYRYGANASWGDSDCGEALRYVCERP